MAVVACTYEHVPSIVYTRIHVCVVWILIVENIIPTYLHVQVHTKCRSYKPTKCSMWYCVSVYVHTHIRR